jgi:hypothetical protein
MVDVGKIVRHLTYLQKHYLGLYNNIFIRESNGLICYYMEISIKVRKFSGVLILAEG